MAVFDWASAVYSSNLMITQWLQTTVISLCSRKQIAQQIQGLYKFKKYQNQDKICIWLLGIMWVPRCSAALPTASADLFQPFKGIMKARYSCHGTTTTYLEANEKQQYIMQHFPNHLPEGTCLLPNNHCYDVLKPHAKHSPLCSHYPFHHALPLKYLHAPCHGSGWNI